MVYLKPLHYGSYQHYFLRISDFMKVVFVPCIAMTIVVIVIGMFIQSLMGMGLVRFVVNTFVMAASVAIFSFMILNNTEKIIIKNIVTKLLKKRL